MRTLRQLGLTLAEIQELAGDYLQGKKDPIGPTLAQVLRVARSRTSRQGLDTPPRGRR